MNPMRVLASGAGPELNRDSVDNVYLAGFEIKTVSNIFMDTVKTIHAVKA